jgi:squalene cyclase
MTESLGHSDMQEFLRELLQEAYNMPCMDELDAQYWDGRISALRAVQRFLGLDEG